MTKLEYLYGVKNATWKELPYLEAFELKNKLAQEVVSEILEQHYSIRDEARLRAVLKAIAFNEERMRE
jgi:hypothetical protein